MSDTLISSLAVMALGTPRDQVRRVSNEPAHQRMSDRNAMTNVLLKARSQRAELALQQSYPNLSRSIGFGVVLRRMFLEHLLDAVDAQFPERFSQQLDYRRFIVAFQRDISVA